MVAKGLVDLMHPTLMSRMVDEGVLTGNIKVILPAGLTMLGLG